MGNRINQLSAVRVATLKEKGLYPDGGGLYLQVNSATSKSWIYRYKVAGRARDMGLGPLSSITLARARELAAECRRLRAEGRDPIAARSNERAKEKLEQARAMTFDQARDAYIDAHNHSWKNAKHRQQWKNTLETYATPVVGTMAVQDIDTAMVLKVVEPIWAVKTETASRVRGRIESVLDWAKARGLRTGENPARWRGHLSNLLPKRSKVRRVRHHRALPYQRMSEFMGDLRARQRVRDNSGGGLAAFALELVILTVVRTTEGLQFKHSEADLQAKVWTIPGERMKSGREHRVPLCDRVVAIVKAMAEIRTIEFVFPGMKPKRPLSNMAMTMLLRDMGYGSIATVHGFRSTFKDWASESTSFANEVSEAALAHVIGDKTEAAYRRGDMFKKRRRLMEAWASFCEPEPLVSKAHPRARISGSRRDATRG